MRIGNPFNLRDPFWMMMDRIVAYVIGAAIASIPFWALARGVGLF